MSDDPDAPDVHEELAFPSPVEAEDLRAWLLFAVPPLAFMVTLAVRFMLTSSACGSSTARVFLEGTALLGALAAAAPAATLLRDAGYARLRGSSDVPGREGSHRLLGHLTLMGSAFFTLLVVAIWIPSLVMSPCHP